MVDGDSATVYIVLYIYSTRQLPLQYIVIRNRVTTDFGSIPRVPLGRGGGSGGGVQRRGEGSRQSRRILHMADARETRGTRRYIIYIPRGKRQLQSLSPNRTRSRDGAPARREARLLALSPARVYRPVAAKTGGVAPVTPAPHANQLSSCNCLIIIYTYI